MKTKLCLVILFQAMCTERLQLTSFEWLQNQRWCKAVVFSAAYLILKLQHSENH